MVGDLKEYHLPASPSFVLWTKNKVWPSGSSLLWKTFQTMKGLNISDFGTEKHPHKSFNYSGTNKLFYIIFSGIINNAQNLYCTECYLVT